MTTPTPELVTNPLFAPSDVPFGAPPFDRLRDEHYLPAVEEGMRRQRAEIEAIAAQTEPATFDNTIVALERSGDLLSRSLRALHAVTGTNTNDVLQDVQTEIAPKLAAHNDEMFLDDRLFKRLEHIHSSNAESFTPEQRELVRRYYSDFRRAGAQLGARDKETLRALNQEESTLLADFQNRLLAATKRAAVVFDDVADLAGMSADNVAAAAQAARDRGLDGKWVVTIHNTTQQPVLESLTNRDVRRRIFEASLHRADGGDELDTRAIIARLAAIRAQRAHLLGFATNADYTLDDQMAKTPSAAIKLLTDVVKTAVAKVRADAARMQAMIDAEGGAFTLEPWDWQFYAEKLRRAEYDLDDAQLRPYFALDRVVHDGVFFAAQRLYGLEFRERHDIPVYHPDVRVYEVFDADGSSLSLFYTDFYKRDNKSGGAWMDAYVDQSRLLGRKPVIVNVCNFTKPAAGKQALLALEDVITLFHEFGHTLHGMLSNVVYPTLTGTNVPRDFVEFPSQFNEHWALEPSVFARYAIHTDTGEAMPPALFERIKKARRFNQGFALTEYASAALLDMAWHVIKEGDAPSDVAAFERDALTRFGVNVREVPPRYDSTYFAHIWDGGYEASYYAYLWAEVLDHDAYEWFEERGGMTPENGRIFRDRILSRGGTDDPAELYRAFRGRDPVIDPLLAARGLLPESGDR